jgi:CDP-diacylglycerol--glycerol-3-phosphate 3-phosphatidyltransferase
MLVGSQGRWITWANLLSGLRLATVVPCVLAVLGLHWRVAAGCFVFAVATDLLDGPLARRRDEASALGGLLDHGSDALFVSSSLMALAMLERVPVILPVLVVAAFLQYVFDSHALAGRSLRTSQLGRWNGIGYYVLVGIVIISEALELGWPPGAWITAIGWALVLATVASMADRARALFTHT